MGLKIFLRSTTTSPLINLQSPRSSTRPHAARRQHTPAADPYPPLHSDLSERYGAETKRLKLDAGVEVDALIQTFREKFCLKPDDKPHKGALYMVRRPLNPLITLFQPSFSHDRPLVATKMQFLTTGCDETLGFYYGLRRNPRVERHV